MRVFAIATAALWVAFLAYWVFAAGSAKPGTRNSQHVAVRFTIALAVVLIVRVLKPSVGEVHSVVVGAVGLAVIVAGLGFAVWARLHLGRNWGMPMTVKEDPELITTGPYALVRNPIYSGMLLALIGTALTTNLAVLIAAVALGAYFVYSATVEDRNLTRLFPDTYPAYRERTKMLIPYVL